MNDKPEDHYPHLHPTSAHKAACPMCNPTKTVPELNQAYASLTSNPEINESGWVLVKYLEPGRVIHYLHVSEAGLFEWTTENLNALRLARREDGDMLARIIDDADAVEEHSWYSPGVKPDETTEHPHCHCGSFLERTAHGRYKCGVCSILDDCHLCSKVDSPVEPTPDQTGGDPECFGSAGAPRSEEEFRARVGLPPKATETPSTEWCMHLTTYDDCPYGCTPENGSATQEQT